VTRRVAASVPLAVVLLDATAVAILLPDIRLDLGSSTSGAQWVLNAYLLALAASYPLLAQLRGRALTVAGTAAMAAGAVVCALADSTAVLVTGQAVQGVGAAALLAPVASSWTAVALPAAALALGPLVGGVFAEQNWWRIFFWAGVPLAALAGTAALLEPRAPSRADTARRLAFAAGLTALTIAMVQGEVWAWGWWALLLLAGAAMLGRARLNELPIGALAWAALAGCLAALLFLLPEYFQLSRNLSGSRSGLLVLGVTFSAVAAWAVAAWLGRRVPQTAQTLFGVTCLGAGLAILATIDARTRWALLIGGLGLTGLGLGATASAVRLAQPDANARSLAAALAGSALGLAGAGCAFQIAQADERGSGASFEQALAAGVGWAAVFLLVLLAAAALVTWRVERTTPAPSEAHPAAGS
jgi:hypothetical protein